MSSPLSEVKIHPHRLSGTEIGRERRRRKDKEGEVREKTRENTVGDRCEPGLVPVRLFLGTPVTTLLSAYSSWRNPFLLGFDVLGSLPSSVPLSVPSPLRTVRGSCVGP